MERHKYNTEFEQMQVFALKTSDLEKIKGGNLIETIVEWLTSLLEHFAEPMGTTDPDGNNGHGGGPK